MNRTTNPRHWTYSEYARLPHDGNRYEVLDGEVLVTPAPTPHHQKVVLRLALKLTEYVERPRLGWVFQDVDLLFATGHFLRPDVAVVPASARDGITDRGIERPPALVVEVQSPSSVRTDRVLKPRRYLEFGVPAFWVIDPLEGIVVIWDVHSGPATPHIERERVRWTMPGAGDGIELDIGALIAPV